MAMAVVPTDASPRGGTRCTRVQPPLRGWQRGWNGSRPGRVVAKEVSLSTSFVKAARRQRTHGAERRQLGRRPAQDWRPTRPPRGPPCDLRAVRAVSECGPLGRERSPPGAPRHPRRATSRPQRGRAGPAPGRPRAARNAAADLVRSGIKEPVASPCGSCDAIAVRSAWLGGFPPPMPPPPTMGDGMPTTTHARPYGTCPTTVASARGGLPPPLSPVGQGTYAAARRQPTASSRVRRRPHPRSSHVRVFRAHTARRGRRGRGGGRMAPIRSIFAALAIAGRATAPSLPLQRSAAEGNRRTGVNRCPLSATRQTRARRRGGRRSLASVVPRLWASFLGEDIDGSAVVLRHPESVTPSILLLDHHARFRHPPSTTCVSPHPRRPVLVLPRPAELPRHLQAYPTLGC